ncbi:hypothetical protein [Streptomyces sp. NPDC058861]|uniref:hypothetical protein n=1 Tax=Streptomyces sp. NPDC058861 TaxID=3346653 RepID=UPI00368DE5F1
MGIHFTTVVIPGALMGREEDNALLLLAGETEEDIGNLPLPVALHVVGNEVGAFGPHAHALGVPMPVSDRWIRAAGATEQFQAQAQVCVVLEPLTVGAPTTDVPASEGVDEPDLPKWVMDVLMQRYKSAVRTVHVSTGSLGMVDAALNAPTTLPEWADHLITP